MTPQTNPFDRIMPRRLAIQLLHEAQIAQPAAIRGVVLDDQGEPGRWLPRSAPAGTAIWARLWSVPLAAAEPNAEELADGGLHLLISLNTKGVLEMRAWQLVDGVPVERRLKIRED